MAKVKGDNKEYWQKRYTKFNSIPEKIVCRIEWSQEEYHKYTEILWNDIKKYVVVPVVRKQGNILDYGCGIGRLAPYLSKEFHKYFGTDLVEDGIALAKTRNQHLPNVQFEILDNGVIPYGDTTFDLIWTCTVLQHIMDDALLGTVADQFSQRINSGGRLVITENIARHEDSLHMRFRTQDEYIKLFSDRGFVFRDNGIYIDKFEEHSVMVFEAK